MRSEWKWVTLGEVTDILGDGIHGTPSYSQNGEYAFINGNNLVSGHIEIKDSTKRVNTFEYEKHRRPLCDRTILVSINGTLGNVALYRGENVILGKSACYFNVSNDVCKEYIYFQVLSPDFQRYLENQATGTTIKNISLKQMREYAFLLPPIHIQKAITNILLALNDKIELNQRINNNLEQQAQAVYTDMFVANANPSWLHGHLSDLVTVKYGKDHKKLADGIYPVYGSGGIMRYVERPLYEGESVLIPRKGTLNNVIYVNQPFWSVDTMFYTEMRIPNVAKYVYHFVKAKDLALLNAGSAVPSMTTDILNAMEVIIPSATALEKFETLVAPMYRTMRENVIQSETLAKLRDTLLPKLMSGEIDVPGIQF